MPQFPYCEVVNILSTPITRLLIRTPQTRHRSAMLNIQHSSDFVAVQLEMFLDLFQEQQ